MWNHANAAGDRHAVGRFALDWGQDNLKPEFRGDEAAGYHIGPAVPLSDEAPVYDRLAAFSGRDPSR